jgi:hypothetical protein
MTTRSGHSESVFWAVMRVWRPWLPTQHYLSTFLYGYTNLNLPTQHQAIKPRIWLSYVALWSSCPIELKHVMNSHTRLYKFDCFNFLVEIVSISTIVSWFSTGPLSFWTDAGVEGQSNYLINYLEITQEIKRIKFKIP